MATNVADSMVDHSVLDLTNDAINGTEVDENTTALAQVLDGTSSVVMAGAGVVDFNAVRVLDTGATATAVQTNLTLEWDPSNSTNMTDNSSGIGIDFKMPDDADNQDVFASLNVMCVSDATTTENGEFSFKVMTDGTNSEVMTLQSTLGAAGTVLTLATAEPTVVDDDVLGRIDFRAPAETGADALLVCASVYAESNDTFSATVNDTDLVFAVAYSETAAERMRLGYNGSAVGLSFSGAATIDSGGNNALGLNAGTEDVVVTASNIEPASNDGSALGTSGTAWSDLFLADGGVINFNAGNLTVTHSAGVLTVNGNIAATDLDGIIGSNTAAAGTFTTIAGTSVTGSGVISTSDDTNATSTTAASLKTAGGIAWVLDAYVGDDMFFTSGAVLNFASGDVTVTHSSNTLTVAGNVVATDLDGIIGSNTAAAGTFTTLAATNIDGIIGANTAAAGTFTTITAGGDVVVGNGYGLIVGNASQETISVGDGATDLVPEVQVLGTAAADASLMLAAFSATATTAGSPILAFVKGGNGTIGSHTVVTDGEELGNIIAYGDDGTDLEAVAAQIQFEVDGTPGTGDMPGRILFSTTAGSAETATERMRIEASGDVGIGTTPDATTRFHVVSPHANQTAYLENSSSGNSYGLFIHLSGASNNNETTTFIDILDSTERKAVCFSNGDWENKANSYGGISDLKLKTDIRDVRSYWDNFKALEYKKFKFRSDIEQYGNDDAKDRLGLIAQDVEEIFPALVRHTPDKRKDTDINSATFGEFIDLNTETLGLKNSIIDGVINSIVLQEAMARIETLETKVTALENA